MDEHNIELYVFAPGGSYNAMKECCETFSRLWDVVVVVVKGPPEKWFDRRADLIYGGAPYMLLDFAAAHPEAIDPQSIYWLYERQVGILVRKGNPHGIGVLNDLARA